MKAKFRTRREIFNPAARRAKLAEKLQQNSLKLESKIKLRISSSNPAGRTYRRGAIVRAKSRSAGLPFRSSGKGIAVAYGFHRASREGQPPAIDKGFLINSIRARQILQFKYRVGTAAVYAAALDAPDGLNRPFFMVTVEEFRPEFFADIRGAVLELLGKK